MASVIKHITHPYPQEVWQARTDEAIITNQPMVERPWWYRDTETGRLYHDIYACIGWPSQVSDKDTGLPGYIAIVGVIRPKDIGRDTHYNPLNAKFLLMAENESDDVPTLLDMCLDMREKYGFGVQPNLMKVWFGDPERFITTLALKNERLIKYGGDNNAILVTPPDDYYTPNIFDNYVRSIKSCLIPGKIRFFFGNCDILKNRLREFKRDDPAVLGAGGLIHSLLSRTTWMDTIQGSAAFTTEE